MHWVTWCVLSVLAAQGFGKQGDNSNNLGQGTGTGTGTRTRTVRLDPLLRRALLRALTELEREAQEKVKEEETRNTRSENDIQKKEESNKEEIQSTADSSYPTANPSVVQETGVPQESSTNQPVDATPPVTVQDTFFFQTPSPIEDEYNNNLNQETKSPDATLIPPDVETNFISEDVKTKDEPTTKKPEEANTEKVESENSTKKSAPSKTVISDNDVDIFKAPLVAAFTLHQDSKGTPHSVIPLFRKNQDLLNQRQKLLEQQFSLLKRQQELLSRQNQFIPSVTITPLSQPHHFNHPSRDFSSSSSFPSSTAFPPLVSNSILPQSFPSSVVPAQSFHVSSTVAPFANFPSTVSPLRNFSPQALSSTLHPQQDFSSVSSHSFNFSPTPQPNFQSPTPPPSRGFQPISIPPVTLPLQNEPRLQSPIVVPSVQLNPEQSFQEQQRIRNQFLVDEHNRQRQRQLEEERLQNNQKAADQLRQQRQEQGVDFQRSLGFTFNQNVKSGGFNRIPQAPHNAFNFQIQPSQSFVSSIGFNDVESRNRVNRQEGFVNTGNLGFNRPTKEQDQQRAFPQFQFSFQQQQPQQYRTIPEEHYRSIQNNRFQQPVPQATRFQPIVQPSNFQFRPQINQFQQSQTQTQIQIQPSVNKQLENLLYQSGVATDASGQEDLNIVSKVLALNHERSDTELQGDRRTEEAGKNLLVGEIKDVQVTTPFSVHV